MAHHGHDHGTRDREVIVTERRARGPGAIIALIIGLVIAGLIAWAVWAFAVGGDDGGVIDVPEEIEIEDGGGGGDGGE